MGRVRLIIGWAVVALIAFTAQSAAQARAMPGPDGQMVICTGAGPVMVHVDADGNPVSAPHICPDYALGLIAALDAAPLTLGPSGLQERVTQEFAVLAAPAVPFGTPNARAPPSVV